MRFEAVFWLDASGRVSRRAKPSDWQKVYDTARVTDGVVMFRGSKRDVFQCTHKGMYRLVYFFMREHRVLSKRHFLDNLMSACLEILAKTDTL